MVVVGASGGERGDVVVMVIRGLPGSEMEGGKERKGCRVKSLEIPHTKLPTAGTIKSYIPRLYYPVDRSNVYPEKGKKRQG